MLLGLQTAARNWRIGAVIVLASVLALALGVAVPRFGFGARELAILVLGLAGIALLVAPTEGVLRWGFWFWILTFGFGWRALYLTPALNIHPIEVLCYLLFSLFVMQAVLQRKVLDWHIPRLLLVLLGFGVLGILIALVFGNGWDITLQEGKQFLILVPMYYLVRWCVRERADWERMVLLMIGVGTYIALLGILDLMFPNVSRAVANDPTVATSYDAQNYAGSNFQRVGFVFFGSFLAGFVILSFFGFTVHHFWTRLAAKQKTWLLYAALAALQLVAMYITGFRGLWYSVIVFFGLYALLRPRGWVVALVGVAMLPFLPSQFYARFNSLFDSSLVDSSQLDRIGRAEGALARFNESPLLGVGWSGSGYVHSDLLQLAANLGIFAIAAFLAWWANLMVLAWRLGQRRDWVGEYGVALFAGLGALLVSLAGEGLLNYVQIIAPVWLWCVLVYQLKNLATRETIRAT